VHYALWTVQQQSCISNTTVFCISRIISRCRPRVPMYNTILCFFTRTETNRPWTLFFSLSSRVSVQPPPSNTRTWRTSRAPQKDINNGKIKSSKKSRIIKIYHTIYLTERISKNNCAYARTHENDIICIVSGTEEKLFRVIGTCGQFPARRNR